MAKIDLSGKSGWQSKSSDQLKELEKGEYLHEVIELAPDKIVADWVKPGTMVTIEEGELVLIVNGEEMKYEKGEVIVFNNENTKDFEIKISEKIKLQVFISK